LPAIDFGGFGGQCGTQGGSGVGKRDPDAEGVGEFLLGENVVHGSASIGKTGRTEEALEESQNKESEKAVESHGRCQERNRDEGENCANVDWVPSDPADFRERCPEKWT
jgi:hypothetical protein